jgi:glutamyl-tRNA reductase
VVTKEMIEDVLKRRGNRPLLIIDLSQPRNVEESIASLPNINLCNIDDLREIAELNLKARLSELRKAKEFIEKKLASFKLKLESEEEVEPLISAIFRRADKIRRKEFERAIKIGGFDKKQREVLGDFSYEIVERLLHDLATNLRKAFREGNKDLILATRQLFSLEKE